MKSWKKERCRRKQLFYSIKLRRHISRDLANWSDMLLRNMRTNAENIAKITRIMRGEE